MTSKRNEGWEGLLDAADARLLPANRRVRVRRAPADVVDAPTEQSGPALADDHDIPIRPRRSNQAAAGKPRAELTAGGGSVMARIRAAAGILLVAATSIAVAWGIRHHVMTSPRFAVRTIRVDGTNRRSSEQVVAFAGLRPGANIFGVDLEGARLRILQDPWIEKADVRRKLPSTLLVDVSEREASAAVAIGSELYLCTHEGELFKQLEPGDPSQLVVISGLTPEQVAQDRPAVVRRIRGALDLLADYERRGPAKRLAVQELNLGEDGTLRMVVGHEGVVLELGQPPFRQKILRAARVLEEVDRRRAGPGVVFLDNEAHPDRVVVRMR